MRPNWFVALPLDGRFVTELPPVPAGFRRLAPEDVHLTLAFLGACSEIKARDAFAAVAEAVARVPQAPIAVGLGEVVAMGRPGAYTALSALLDGGREQACSAIARLRHTALQAADARPDRRPPRPHVTIVRPMHRATNEQRAAGLSWAASLDLSHVHDTLDRIALYTWAQPRGQIKFRIVAEIELAS